MGAWMTMTMAALAFAFTACSEEDLVQPANSQAGTLHITSVSVDGQQVGGRSRAVADDGTPYDYENAPYNQSLNSFGNGDKIKLSYNFGGAGDDAPAPVYATYNNGTWTIDVNIAPRAEEESETWGRLDMTTTANAHKELIGDPEEEEEEDDDIYDEHIEEYADGGEEESEYAAAARVLGIVAGEGIESANIRLLTDFLYATIADGSISIDKTLTSPTLGATTISFKHASRALLRLPIPVGGFNVAGTYVVNGTAHHVTGLATLWAVVKDGEYTYYYPLTAVGSNLQAIVYSGVSVVGFKAVLTTDASGAVGSNGFDASKTFTLDLPFKVDNTASTGIELAENTQYPLTLTLSPNKAVVNLASATGKPGWGTNVQEHEYDNSPNDMFKEAMRELKFVKETSSVGTFEVSGPNGLMVLNKWMTGSITFDKFKSLNFEGATNFTDSYSRLKQNIKLMVDITLPAVGTGESNWTPIGTGTTWQTTYNGIFDGNGMTLKNLTINSTSNHVGLIGSIDGGKIRNLTLNNVTVKGNDFVGSIAGCNVYSSTVIENCTVESGKVEGFTKVGGIVGSCATNKLVTNCINNAKVTGYGLVGGIMGENSAPLKNCINHGQVNVPYNTSISVSSQSVGGIAGYNTANISACSNYGSVTVNAYCSPSGIGGIVGCHDYRDTTIEGCFNFAQVKQTNNSGDNKHYVGGVIGFLNIGKCFASGNIGSVLGGKKVGGIIGYTYSNVKIYGCWSKTTSESAPTSSGDTNSDGLGYFNDRGSYNYKKGCYTSSSPSYINNLVGLANDYTSGETISMNKAIGNNSQWRWVVGTDPDTDWPTLTFVE